MEKINFEDLPSENTPLNADNLNRLQQNVENGISDAIKNQFLGYRPMVGLNVIPIGLSYIWLSENWLIFPQVTVPVGTVIIIAKTSDTYYRALGLYGDKIFNIINNNGAYTIKTIATP